MKIRTILLSLLGVLILLVAIAALNLGAKRWNVSRRIAAIRNSGAPVSFAELIAGQLLTSTSDASAHLGSVTKAANGLYRELGPILHPDGEFDWQAGLDDAEQSKIEAIYEKYPDVMPAWKKATESRYHRWEIRSPVPAVFQQDVLNAVGDVRLHSRLAACRAEYLASSGQADEAIQVCVSQFQLLDLQDSGFGIAHFLSMAACRGQLVRTMDAIVRTHPLSDSSHQTIEATLARQDALPGFTHGLETERVVGIESFQTMPIPVRWFSGGLIEYLDFMESEIAAGGQSAWKLPQGGRVLPQGIAGTVVPAIDQAREAMNRLRRDMRRLRILNAMVKQGITLEKQGTKPDEPTADQVDLTLLGLPKDATIDPFSGEPLYQAEVPGSPL